MSLEFIQIAEAVAREKDIAKEEVLGVMEQAIQMAARRKYGMDLNVEAHIDRVSGDVSLKKIIKAVAQVMEPISIEEVRAAQREEREPLMQAAKDPRTGKALTQNGNQILIAEARKINPDIKMGECLVEDLPPIDFGRVAAQAAKQVIFQKVKDVERGHEYEEYKDRVGEVISGIVKRTDYHGALIDLGKAEAFLPREETIQRETFRQNDRVRGYIYKVEQTQRGPQIFISRTHPAFLMALFKEEVPEVANGTIEIINAARDPGFRAKMAVKSYDRNLDPVGACVGIRGVRVQAVTAELQGERVDIIEHSTNPADFLVKAMAPAIVTKVVLDEDENRIEVVVPEDNLSLAIGRRGQNVRLASQLTGWDIDVMTEAEESDRRSQELEVLTSKFIENLDVDDVLARLLISEGFHTVDDLLKVESAELAHIEGLNEEIAEELQNRAQASVDEAQKRTKKLGVDAELTNLASMSSDVLLILAENNIKTLDDLGDLATDELQEILPSGLLNDKQAEKLIMSARAHWFADEEAENEPLDEDEDDNAAETAETNPADAEEPALATA